MITWKKIFVKECRLAEHFHPQLIPHGSNDHFKFSETNFRRAKKKPNKKKINQRTGLQQKVNYYKKLIKIKNKL